MKKILILGGGQAQIGLIQAAKQMNLFVIVVGIEGNYPGYQYADMVYNIDIFDKDAVLKVAKEEQIDGIAMVCSDFGLETVGYVNDHLHLSGISEKAAIDSSNKLKMKELLQNAGINTAKFCIVKNDQDINDVLQKLKFPLIVKAVDLQGSRGIYICRTQEELFNNYKKSIEESQKDFCLVEEFIEGIEFGAQAFIEKGQVLFVEPHGDEVLKTTETNIPVGHYMPYTEKTNVLYSKIKDISCDAIRALGFDNCAVNIDLIMKDEVPYIIELTGRAGANFLPELTSHYLGLNYYEMVILEAIGGSAKEYYNNRVGSSNAVLTKMLYSEKDGIINDLEVISDDNVKLCIFYVSRGDKVKHFTNSRDCIGKLLCLGNTVEDCKNNAENFIRDNIKIEII